MENQHRKIKGYRELQINLRKENNFKNKRCKN